jgi:phenylalanyl-tRNA synthetase beta chain
MTISLNWLKEIIDIPYTIEELDYTLTMLGLEVEKIHTSGKEFQGFVIGKVLTKEKHPDADKLSVCNVFDGTEERQIICGAPNVDAGQTIVVALPGAKVPHGGFEIAKRKIRGIESHGMICSQAELGIGEDTGGIWVLPDNSTIGMSLAQYLGLDDTIIEIGITPNRADCLSHIGIAREIAARTGGSIRLPSLQLTEDKNHSIHNDITIDVDTTSLCPRYAARTVKNVRIIESPLWLKQRLESIGMRPRNVIVDITNLVLMECGQPLHAFDLDTIQQRKVIVKTAQPQEEFTTLDGKKRILDEKMLMISDAERHIAVAGVMGGENSEISDSTVNVLIESAYFNPSSIRRTAKKLGISSDASYRFERGVDPDTIIYAVNRAAQLMADLAGGTITQGIIDIYDNPVIPPTITLRFAQIERVLGISVPTDTIQSFITSIGCIIISSQTDSITVQAPSWRVDIHQEIDLIEEIARLYNYDNIEPDRNAIFPADAEISPLFTSPERRHTIRHYLVHRGLHEIITYSFTDAGTASLSNTQTITIANPLGEEFSVMRPSLLPAMMKVIDRNCRNGQSSLALFDCGKIFSASKEKTFIKGIREKEELCIALTGDYQHQHWAEKQRKYDFYDIKGIVEELLFDSLHLSGIMLVPSEQDNAMYGPNRMDIIAHKKIIGTLGEVHRSIIKKFGIDQAVFAASISLSDIYTHPQKKLHYTMVSPFPFVRRDAAFTLAEDIAADEILRAVKGVNSPLLKGANIFDVFTGATVGEGKKSIALALTFGSDERTLVDLEINTHFQAIVEAIESGTGATLRQ